MIMTKYGRVIALVVCLGVAITLVLMMSKAAVSVKTAVETRNNKTIQMLEKLE